MFTNIYMKIFLHVIWKKSLCEFTIYSWLGCLCRPTINASAWRVTKFSWTRTGSTKAQTPIARIRAIGRAVVAQKSIRASCGYKNIILIYLQLFKSDQSEGQNIFSSILNLYQGRSGFSLLLNMQHRNIIKFSSFLCIFALKINALSM